MEYPTGATTFGSIANIKCNIGYIINGVDTISCLETGKWNSKPQCVIEGTCTGKKDIIISCLTMPVDTDLFNLILFHSSEKKTLKVSQQYSLA